MDTYQEVWDPRRVDLVARIAAHIPPGESVEPGFWALVWLSDVERLENLVHQFENAVDAADKRAFYENTMWTKSLRTWATRDHVIKSKIVPKVPGIETPKRKSTSEMDPHHAKFSRRPESLAEAERRESYIIPAPRGRSGTRSPSKIPRPAAPPPLAATPATPAPSTATIPRQAESSELREYRRSPAMADKCQQRDNDACVITKGGDCTEVAHIYPFSLGTKVGQTTHRAFWETLSKFWSQDQVHKWEESVFGPKRTEILQNLLCLDPTAHALWGKAKFALKPLQLSLNSDTLTVQFYWLGHSTYAFKDLQTPPSQPSNIQSAVRGTRLFDCMNNRCLESGDVLTLTTNDPQNLPLPSIEILRLQWFLNRLVSLSGAADVTDNEIDPDNSMALAPPILAGSDDELSWEEEEETEEESEEARGLQVGTATSSAAPVTRIGENRPLAQAEGKQGESAVENPLVLRTRDPNIY
ncbi:hypothetical protein BJY01DRAFT_253492 [Aspergillus pseudoustus]|uniref:HNH nuclease domain-containing protein n=1 Tax=Aspergillus pseudoustus TaxID=1810923 RepID=A0ABR4J0G5_9EURO